MSPERNREVFQARSEQPPAGRIYNSRNPEFEDGRAARDISSVDQQEGNMNNGELGGCFNISSEQQEGEQQEA